MKVRREPQRVAALAQRAQQPWGTSRGHTEPSRVKERLVLETDPADHSSTDHR